MRRGTAAGLLATTLVAGALYAAQGPAAHVCAPDEGKGTCALGRVRACDSTGALAGCDCPPGTWASSSGATCALDAKASPPASCVVPDATIGDALGPSLELGALEVPSLPQIAPPSAIDAVAALDGKGLDALGADDLVSLAAAHLAIEGAAAWDAASTKKPKLGSLIVRRDATVSRQIDVRRAFLARFGTDPRGPAMRVALARALLRRAAYGAVGANADLDRAAARAQLSTVTKDAPGSVSARDASFMLGERAAREKSWALLLALDSDTAKWALPKGDADDHAYLAAAYARIVQARLQLGDLAAAKAAAPDAIDAGNACAPRAECVSAASAVRAIADRLWAATASPARTLAPLLQRGPLTKHERALPLVRLAARDAGAAGPGCHAAAEEAAAWAQVIGR